MSLHQGVDRYQSTVTLGIKTLGGLLLVESLIESIETVFFRRRGSLGLILLFGVIAGMNRQSDFLGEPMVQVDQFATHRAKRHRGSLDICRKELPASRALDFGEVGHGGHGGTVCSERKTRDCNQDSEFVGFRTGLASSGNTAANPIRV